MDPFHQRLIVRAATIDELLSGDFEPLPGQKGEVDLAARRLAAWCRSSASGDWLLFGRRLVRDGLAIDQVLARFSSVHGKAFVSPPAWLKDAVWIEAALQGPAAIASTAAPEWSEPYPFEQLFTPVVEQAERLLWSDIGGQASENLNDSARACLRRSLLEKLCEFSSPAIYECFVKARKVDELSLDTAHRQIGRDTFRYDRFVSDMKAGGFRTLFDEKPVLLRLLATITRQWIDTSREFILRLDEDLASIRRDILHSGDHCRVARIEGELSDPHNDGHSVLIIGFEDDSRVVYKPKDLRLDAAWYALIERLNRAEPPVPLKAPRAIARDGYGWSEFIHHTGCADQDGCKRFFERAGAWLALFHLFVASDMHQENMIAAGDHPVPIDLETILQAAAVAQKDQDEPERQAVDAATEAITNSVMMVGMLPAYARSPDNKVFAMGGMTADWRSRIRIMWSNINTDDMRPSKSKEVDGTNPNLPHIDGRYAKFGDHVGNFVTGFEAYARFLLKRSRGKDQGGLLEGFAGLPVRKVIRPTRFYAMLLQRMKNHRAMDDGVTWSAQADFVARLAEWESDIDPIWPLHRAERSALIALNVPHFVMLSDGSEIRDASGVAIQTEVLSGLDRARARLRSFDEDEINWQLDVIRENTRTIAGTTGPVIAGDLLRQAEHSATADAPSKAMFIAEADRIAKQLSRRAIRKGPGAAWIGLDWLGDAEVFQLACLGPDLYNGVSGIGVFLAAHAAVTGHKPSGELALAGFSYFRKRLQSRNAARMARTMGIGGAVGLGSIVYAMSVMSKCLDDDSLLADALVVAKLFTDDLIAADKKLDAIGGSAGAILGLLRLYRDTESADVLTRATKCGEHLIKQGRLGSKGHMSWVGEGFGPQPLNGMSHGASGFAFALASLSEATGRDDFRQAANECIAFENASYDADRNNWPDLRQIEASVWPCQWCHGATGIGLARVAMTRQGGFDSGLLTKDVGHALAGVERGWPNQVDTLCCGTLGSIEFLCEAGNALGKDELRELASRRLAALLEVARTSGDYRWNSGNSRFNLGLFRGLAGVGYTSLRQVDDSLPNLLIWE